MPNENLPLPMEIARSANAGPNVLVVRENVPSVASYAYVKPPDEEPIGKIDACEPICWLT